MLNMFVGVVVENFHRCREEQEKEERARRAVKRAWKLEKRRRSKSHLIKPAVFYKSCFHTIYSGRIFPNKCAVWCFELEFHYDIKAVMFKQRMKNQQA